MFDMKKSEEKISYEAPKLVVYGDVLEMTAGGTAGNGEVNPTQCGSNMNRDCLF